MFDKKIGFGYATLFLYCLITGVSIFSIHQAAQLADPISLALYVFLSCALIFNALNFKNIRSTYAVANSDRKSILTLNVLTAIVWLSTFWSLKYISPTVFIVIYMGIIPITAYLTQVIKTQKSSWTELLLIIILAILIASIVTVHELLFPSRNPTLLQGILPAIIAGVSGNFYVLYSRYLQHKLNLVSLDISSLRFYLLIFIGIIWALAHVSTHQLTIGITAYNVLFITLVSSVLPLYLLQNSIHNLGPLKTAYILPLTLIFTYWVELVSGVQFEWSLLLLIVLLVTILALPLKMESKSSS
ncbi:MAG: hypothetical protein JSS53_08255 [Proteobacteria bacterium]|nr:hypothetical protein [Pseudomonadota bacterium]